MPLMPNKKIVLFALFPLLFFLLILEGSARIWGDFLPNRVLCYDPILGRSYCANTSGYIKDYKTKSYIEINADGLLGKSYPVKRQPEIKRIAILGDSFTSGEAVTPDKKFTGQWETKLAKRFSAGVEVINFGVGGTGTWQQLQRFHVKARKYNPDLTVLVFCWCNDIENNIDQLKSKNRNPLLDDYHIGFKEKFQVKRKNFNQWIWNNSALYQFTRTRYNHLEHYVKGFFRPEYMQLPTKEKTPASIKPLLDTVSMYDDKLFFDSEGWQLTKQLILKLKNEVLLNGGELAVIQMGGAPEYTTASRLPVKQFSQFLKSHKIHNYNVIENFIDMDTNGLASNFIPNDGHFSAKGHHSFSEFTMEFLGNLILNSANKNI